MEFVSFVRYSVRHTNTAESDRSEKTASHTARVDNLEVLGSEQRDEVLGIARRWLRHYKYW